VYETHSLSEAFRSVAETFAGKSALAAEGTELTYGSLLERASRVANGIRRLCGTSTNPVVLVFRNHPEFLPAYLGCSLAGIIPVVVYPDYGWTTVSRIIRDTGTRLVICDPTDRTAAVVEAAQAGSNAPVPAVTIADLLTAHCAEPETANDSNETMVILASSGTTGKPKLIGRSHDGFLAASRRFGELWGCRESIRFGVGSLITHAAALGWGVHPVLLAGGVLVVETDRRAERLLDSFARHRVEVTFLVPSHARRLLRAVISGTAAAPESLKLIILGGEPLDPALAEELHRHFHCDIQNTYGMSEGFCTATRRGDLNEILSGSVGEPCFFDDKIRILTPEGEPVPPGTPGELWVSGRAMVRSYWNSAPDARIFTSDGFFRTGDRMCVTEGRNLKFVGRTSLMINRAGVKVSPEELEQAIVRLPGVEAATVTAVADPEIGQRIAAVLQVDLRYPAYTLARLRDALSASGVGKAILPDQIQLVDELPASPLGKVDRQAVLAGFKAVTA
jgi:2,3-dihydroxybenzoate-AMP ligase